VSADELSADELIDLARYLTFLALVKDQVEVLSKELREEFDGLLSKAGRRQVDVTRPAAEKGEEAVAAIVPTSGKRTVTVTDDNAWFAFVLVNYPQKLVKVVDPVWQAAFFKGVLAAGAPVDTKTGREIDGVEIKKSDPGFSIKPTRDAKEAMGKLLAASGLLERGLKALPAPPTPDVPETPAAVAVGTPSGDGPSASEWGFAHLAASVPDDVGVNTGGGLTGEAPAKVPLSGLLSDG
jgi:hypothetical protein